ncbi:hypothetical protein HYC85_006013 [Camellia sinensis]|uniref:Uncharacterized protein n=1 Tax=Camellia sinensis TaxID=4442 RepID=A0A7J7I3Q9_CAMSI|nr:hypothetical protein HYC85_006013 [Camellia sinensis]
MLTSQPPDPPISLDLQQKTYDGDPYADVANEVLNLSRICKIRYRVWTGSLCELWARGRLCNIEGNGSEYVRHCCTSKIWTDI